MNDPKQKSLHDILKPFVNNNRDYAEDCRRSASPDIYQAYERTFINLVSKYTIYKKTIESVKLKKNALISPTLTVEEFLEKRLPPLPEVARLHSDQTSYSTEKASILSQKLRGLYPNLSTSFMEKKLPVTQANQEKPDAQITPRH